MLGAASDLIAEHGWVGLKMKDIALRAQVPIGSVYQYFPNRSAIIVAIAQRYFAKIQGIASDRLTAANDINSLRKAIAQLLNDVITLTNEDVVFREIWAGTDADREIEPINMADSWKSARAISNRIRELGGDQFDTPDLETRCFMVAHLGGTVARCTFSMDRNQADELRRVFTSMAIEQLFPISSDYSSS